MWRHKAILAVALDFHTNPIYAVIGSFHDEGVTAGGVFCFNWMFLLAIMNFQH